MFGDSENVENNLTVEDCNKRNNLKIIKLLTSQIN